MIADVENRGGRTRSASRRAGSAALPTLFAGGGLLGAVAASSCCLVPLVLFGLGISGAWIGNLTRLAPYQPYFLGVAAACLAAGYWRVWRTRRTACAVGAVCARPLPVRTLITGLIVATILVIAALAVDFILPLFVVP
jgi:mercuric ion transport protein